MPRTKSGSYDKIRDRCAKEIMAEDFADSSSRITKRRQSVMLCRRGID
jgi:hypothetical protein